MTTPLSPAGNLLILLLNGYGDCFLALPVLREIQRKFRSKKVYMAAFEDQIDALFEDLDFDFIRAKGTAAGQVRLDTDLEVLDFQQIASLNAYFPCPVEREMTARYQLLPRWGFCDLSGNPISMAKLHMRDQYFQILGWSPRYSEADRRVFLSDKASAAFAEILKDWKRNLGENAYAIHLDSLPEKMWSTASWVDVVDHIRLRWEAWPVLVGEESEQATALLQRFSYARKLPSTMGISSHFAAIKYTRAFIGIDSIFAHVADSYEKPSGVLFGPSDPAMWGPVNHRSRLLIARNQQLNALSPTEVKHEVDALLRLGF